MTKLIIANFDISLFSKMMVNKSTIIGLAILSSSGLTQANDSAGYIGTGGVQYIKNHNISMKSEDLYISKDKIRVDYQFANLSNRDITETILFPLPPFSGSSDSDYADAGALIDNFNIWSNNKRVYPDVNIRAFMLAKSFSGLDGTAPDDRVDTTELFKSCGVTEQEMMGYWRSDNDLASISRKLLSCDNKALKKIQDKIGFDPDDEYGHSNIFWESQPVYSWEQTFRANSNTFVRHSYKPLVGGSMYFDTPEYKEFCADDISVAQKKHLHTHSALKYILTTGANWATPIEDFTLTVERDPDELMSFCWKGKGKIKKIGTTTFQIKEKNFIPTHDFHVAFAEYMEE